MSRTIYTQRTCNGIGITYPVVLAESQSPVRLLLQKRGPGHHLIGNTSYIIERIDHVPDTVSDADVLMFINSYMPIKNGKIYHRSALTPKPQYYVLDWRTCRPSTEPNGCGYAEIAA